MISSELVGKREAGLEMIQVMYQIMRRGELGDPGMQDHGNTSLDQIVMGCLRAVYEEGLRGKEHLLPYTIANM